MGSNRDWGVDSQTLTIPPFAGPGDARITIGQDLPADLVAFYAAGGYTTVGGIVLFAAGGDYDYLVLAITGGGLPAVVVGTRDAEGVGEAFEFFPIPALALSQILFGGFGTPQVELIMAANSEQDFNTGSILNLNVGSDFAIDGKSAPRGNIAYVDSAANSAAVGAETVILTLASKTYRANRAYGVEWSGSLLSSVAQITDLRVRKTNAAGQLLNQWTEVVIAGALNRRRTNISYFKVGAADVTGVVVLTASATAGTIAQNAAASNIRHLKTYDAGAGAFYANIPTLV